VSGRVVFHFAARVVGVVACVVACVDVVGCAPPAPAGIQTVFDPCAPLIVDVDDDSTAAEAASVAAGSAMWRSAIDARVDVASADNVDDNAPRVPVRFDPAGASFRGYYDDIAGVVFINDAIVDDDVRAITVAHELGHAFGLLHVSKDVRPSIMNDGNTTVAINDGDRDAIAALWGRCGP
jgi:hypothetical protein